MTNTEQLAKTLAAIRQDFAKGRSGAAVLDDARTLYQCRTGNRLQVVILDGPDRYEISTGTRVKAYTNAHQAAAALTRAALA